MGRVLRAVHHHYRLASLHGFSAETCERAWYFEAPAARDTLAAWRELIHRMYYDENVMCQRREPDDDAWLAVDRFSLDDVDAHNLLIWTGEGDAPAEPAIPWQQATTAVAPACWWIDDDGRYDAMAVDDYSELIALRLFDAGALDQAGLVRVLDRLYPGQGAACFAARARRLANIACVRPTAAFRKTPGEPPIASGPPRPEHVHPPRATR
ncbi:MAG: hypothetical protein R3F59_31650 [Myxococcota bacterium]